MKYIIDWSAIKISFTKYTCEAAICIAPANIAGRIYEIKQSRAERNP
jgi:bifunctional pyridoxal-dependent enzyme with beta-cystathionase and maltose regulon repressor activities